MILRRVQLGVRRLVSWLCNAWMFVWTGGWWPWYYEGLYVVMALDPATPSAPPWHVFGGGVAYNMDYDTGTFTNKEDAYAFAEFRQYEAHQHRDYIYFIQRAGAV